MPCFRMLLTFPAPLLAHGTWQDALMGDALSKSWFDYVWVQVRARHTFCYEGTHTHTHTQGCI